MIVVAADSTRIECRPVEDVRAVDLLNENGEVVDKATVVNGAGTMKPFYGILYVAASC